MMQSESFSWEAITDEEATCVAITSHLLGRDYTATGSSKVHPNDTYVADIGIALAAARAFRRMANELERMVDRRPSRSPHYGHVTWSPNMNYDFIRWAGDITEDGGT